MEDASGSRFFALLKQSFFGDHQPAQVDPKTQELLSNLENYFSSTVQEVMVPRAQMTSIDQRKTLKDALELHHKTGHSRMPVHDERRDNIVGILYSIDLFPHVDKADQMTVAEVMRSPMFISYSQPIHLLLSQFKREHKHMAIVVDEYGGVDGVVTMMDIMEVLVGDIPDEMNKDQEPRFEEVGDGLIVIDSNYDLEDFNQLFQTNFAKEGVETIGGYACHVLGKIPQKNERFKIGDIPFSVEESSESRLLKLKLPAPKAATP